MSARLLVVDDEKSLLEFLTLLFRGEGHEVNGARCMRRPRRNWPHHLSSWCSAIFTCPMAAVWTF